MRTSFPALIALAALAIAPLRAWSADEDAGAPPPDGFAAVASPAADDVPDAPSQPPPAPPAETPPPPQQTAPQASNIPPGQWVYTEQYGWIWMPYGDAYTYAPSDGYGQPYQYVYEPAVGWSWVVAPWVWGWGPWPYFGLYGPTYFAWYQWGWWRHPSFFHFAPGFRSFPYAVHRPFVAPVRPPGARPGTGVAPGGVIGRGGTGSFAPAPSRGGGGGGGSHGRGGGRR